MKLYIIFFLMDVLTVVAYIIVFLGEKIQKTIDIYWKTTIRR